MSLAVGAISSSINKMGFEESKDDEEKKHEISGQTTTTTSTTTSTSYIDTEDRGEEKLSRQMSEASVYGTEEEEEFEERTIELGPQFSLKDQIEKDKDDESLRKWKEQLLGNVDLNSIGETLEADVKILYLTILFPDRPEIVLPIPEAGNPKGTWFTLKEGSHYRLKFSFKVSNNIVSGLRYTNTVWKTGVKVDMTKEMLGVFSPQEECYMHELPEETTPSGIFARGSYSAKTKFIDDDNKCYLEMKYSFDIRKTWTST